MIVTGAGSNQKGLPEGYRLRGHHWPKRWVTDPAYTSRAPRSTGHALTFTDVAGALRWCEVERENLVAATQLAADYGHHDDLAWKLQPGMQQDIHLSMQQDGQPGMQQDVQLTGMVDEGQPGMQQDVQLTGDD